MGMLSPRIPNGLNSFLRGVPRLSLRKRPGPRTLQKGGFGGVNELKGTFV